MNIEYTNNTFDSKGSSGLYIFLWFVVFILFVFLQTEFILMMKDRFNSDEVGAIVVQKHVATTQYYDSENHLRNANWPMIQLRYILNGKEQVANNLGVTSTYYNQVKIGDSVEILVNRDNREHVSLKNLFDNHSAVSAAVLWLIFFVSTGYLIYNRIRKAIKNKPA